MLTISRGLLKKKFSLPRYFYNLSTYSKQEKEQMKLAAQDAAKIINFLSTDAFSNNGLQKNNTTAQSSFRPLSEVILTDLKIQSRQIRQMLDPRIGVKLPLNLVTQQRIKDAFSSSQSFSFFPNRIVTCPIFRLIKQNQSKTLIFGPAGASKTTAIVLFTYLTHVINEYQFQCKQAVPIAKDIPRVFYLSYQNFKGINDYKGLNKSINQQIIKIIKTNLPKTLSEIFKDKNNIGDLYWQMKKEFEDKNLSIKFVIDQFNQYVSSVRRYNYQVERSDKPQLKQLRNKLQLESQLWFEGAHMLTNDNVMYNSSENIEEKYLKQVRQPYFSYNLNYHSPLHRRHVDFYQRIRLPQGKMEILAMLFFELKRKCPDRFIQKIQQAERNFFSNLEYIKDKQNIVFTHFEIRKHIQNNKQINLYKQGQSLNQESIKQQIQQIIDNIYKESMKALGQEAKKFCFKNNESVRVKTLRIKFLSAVRDIILRRTSQKDKQTMSKVTFKQIKQEFGIQKSKDLQFDLSIIDKNLFEYEISDPNNNQRNWVKLKWNQAYFLQLTNFVQVAIKQAISQHGKIFIDIFQEISGSDMASFGLLFDNVITTSIQKQSLNLNFVSHYKIQRTFLLNKALKFLHFNSFPVYLGLQKRFEEFINTKNKQNIVGVPKTLGQKKSANSSSIDFLIFRQALQGYEIYSFDLTVTNQQISKNHEKFVKSKNLFNNIYQNYYGMTADFGTKLDKDQQYLKTKYQQMMKKPLNPLIKTWVHTILCMSISSQKQQFTVQIPHTKKKAKIVIQTSNILLFQIEFSNKASEESQKYQTILEALLRKLRQR